MSAIDQLKEEVTLMNTNIVQGFEEIASGLEEDCDALGGTDSDALEYDDWAGYRDLDYKKSDTLRHYLWLETSVIPRKQCLQRNGKLRWWSGIETEEGLFNCYTEELTSSGGIC